ncbi:MAG TPA: TRAP transporter TatT component family protein [Anaeromyxobacter sp.]|nr:TRAP transporter TatT component family protein [Anaeromyxobacter sp.]
MKRVVLASALCVTAAALSGCRSAALSIAAGAVSGTGTTYASDDDPELVRDAVPFGLKTMEGILAGKPRHEGLLTSLASGFTQYGYAFVQADADAADLDGRLDQARAGRDRARRLFLRARDYGLRGLDVRHAGLAEKLRAGGAGAREALRAADSKEDVPLLYWTAAAWALAISNGKGDMALVAELPAPVAMMERALALDEAWDEGAVHEFFVTYDATRSAAEGGGPERAKAHLERALALSMNKKLGPRVSWAEGVLVQRQDRAEFTRVLEEVVRADPGEVPRHRLANVLAQRRARLLLAHADDLFL